MQILGYLLFSFLLSYLFIFFQFPYERLKQTITQELEETLPMSVTIGRVKPSFPAHLILEKIRLQSGSLRFQVPDLMIQPNLVGLCLGKTDIKLTDSGNPARLHAEVHLGKNRSRAKIQINKLEIKTFTTGDFPFQINLSGEATVQGVGEDLAKGSGRAWVLLERGEIREIQTSQLPLMLALYDTLRAEIQFQEGIVHVKRLEVSGNGKKNSIEGDFQFSGKSISGFPDLGFIFSPPGRQ